MNITSIITQQDVATYSVINSEIGEEQAVALRGKIKKRINEIGIELAPARDQINAIRLEYKPKTDELKVLKKADKIIEFACTKFRQSVMKQIENKKKKLIAEQKAKDEIVKPPIPVTVAESVPNPERIIRTTEGSMSYIPKVKVRVVDITKVPMFYDPSPMTERFPKVQLLIPNMVGLNELLRLKKGYKVVDGRIISDIDGLEFYDDLSTRVMK